MNNRKFIFLSILLFLFSCTNKSKEFDDGFYKAFIAIDNPVKGQHPIDGAHVLMMDDRVEKICFSNNECVDNFDMWEHHEHYQLVFSTGTDERIYKVYVIRKEWESDESDQSTE